VTPEVLHEALTAIEEPAGHLVGIELILERGLGQVRVVRVADAEPDEVPSRPWALALDVCLGLCFDGDEGVRRGHDLLFRST